jgi:hypothetical protein
LHRRLTFISLCCRTARGKRAHRIQYMSLLVLQMKTKLTDLCWVVVGLRPPPGAPFLRGDSLTRLCLRGDCCCCCCCVGVVLLASEARLPPPPPPQLESSEVPPPPSTAGASVPVPSSGVCAGVTVLCSAPQSSARNPSCMAGLRTIPCVITSLSALSRCTFLEVGYEVRKGITSFNRVFSVSKVWNFHESDHKGYCLRGVAPCSLVGKLTILQTICFHGQEDKSFRFSVPHSQDV